MYVLCFSFVPILLESYSVLQTSAWPFIVTLPFLPKHYASAHFPTDMVSTQLLPSQLKMQNHETSLEQVGDEHLCRKQALVKSQVLG